MDQAMVGQMTRQTALCGSVPQQTSLIKCKQPDFLPSQLFSHFLHQFTHQSFSCLTTWQQHHKMQSFSLVTIASVTPAALTAVSFIKHLVQPDQKWLQIQTPPYLHDPPHSVIAFLVYQMQPNHCRFKNCTIFTTTPPNAVNANGFNKPPKQCVVSRLYKHFNSHCKHCRPCNTNRRKTVVQSRLKKHAWPKNTNRLQPRKKQLVQQWKKQPAWPPKHSYAAVAMRSTVAIRSYTTIFVNVMQRSLLLLLLLRLRHLLHLPLHLPLHLQNRYHGPKQPHDRNLLHLRAYPYLLRCLLLHQLLRIRQFYRPPNWPIALRSPPPLHHTSQWKTSIPGFMVNPDLQASLLGKYAYLLLLPPANTFTKCVPTNSALHNTSNQLLAVALDQRPSQPPIGSLLIRIHGRNRRGSTIQHLQGLTPKADPSGIQPAPPVTRWTIRQPTIAEFMWQYHSIAARLGSCRIVAVTTRASSFPFYLVHVVMDQAMIGQVTRQTALCGSVPQQTSLIKCKQPDFLPSQLFSHFLHQFTHQSFSCLTFSIKIIMY